MVAPPALAFRLLTNPNSIQMLGVCRSIHSSKTRGSVSTLVTYQSQTPKTSNSVADLTSLSRTDISRIPSRVVSLEFVVRPDSFELVTAQNTT